jgi:hypothetical protein
VIEDLSSRLTARFGKGFSVPNLKNFRQFYQTYSDRFSSIGYPVGSQSSDTTNFSPMGREMASSPVSSPSGTELVSMTKGFPAGSQKVQGCSPQLSWSHYRALMRVENREARDFYEREAIAGGWDKRTLERQIQVLHYDAC